MKYNPKLGLSLSEVLMGALVVGIVLWFHYTIQLPSERQQTEIDASEKG